MNTRYFNSLAETFLSLKTKRDMKEFLDGILTPKEREEIPVRLQIVKLLKKGIPQHEIASKLGVGIATVTRGSKELAKGNFSNWR
ncbi:MAG: Trp family transcriptional regulator [Candidatus Roizmanbacteria bacterium]|nr:Trp family transcriptional regulator [Candidatus Roizmanbacteria bacterium]